MHNILFIWRIFNIVQFDVKISLVYYTLEAEVEKGGSNQNFCHLAKIK